MTLWYPGFGARISSDRSGPIDHVIGEEKAVLLLSKWQKQWPAPMSVGGVRFATCEMVAQIPEAELATALEIELSEAQAIVAQLRRICP